MLVRGDDGHEHEEHGKDDAVHELGCEHDSHEVDVRDEHDYGADDDDEREDALEHGRFAPLERHACFPAECFADDEGCGEGQDASCKERGCDQADGEERFGVLPGERGERACCRLGAVDLDALRVEHSSRGHDDEPCDEAGGDGSRYGVDLLLEELAGRSALLDDVALREEHHPRGDRRTDHRDDERYPAHAACNLWNDGRGESIVPVGLGEHCRDDIGHEDERQREKHVLHALVTAADDEQPDRHRGDWNGDVLRDAEHLHARRDAGKLRECGGNIADEQGEHGQCRETDAESLADERSKALAGGRAHAACGRLHHDEQDAHDGDDPQRCEAELRARRGVCRNAARVVARHGSDDAGAHRCEDEQQPIFLLAVLAVGF